MNRILIFCVLALLAGCSESGPADKDIVAKVGVYNITRQEFDEAYKDSSYGAKNTPESKQAFLNIMIDQKLILLDAQDQGLDKDPKFLKMVENFWQQSLLTSALKKKSNEGADLDKWVEYLRKNTTVDINQELLK